MNQIIKVICQRYGVCEREFQIRREVFAKMEDAANLYEAMSTSDRDAFVNALEVEDVVGDCLYHIMWYVEMA